MSAVQSLSTPVRVRTVAHVRERWAWYVGRAILYALAVIGAILFMGPFLFALSGSLKTVAEIHVFPPPLLPMRPAFENYARLFDLPGIYFARWYLNSLLITSAAVSGHRA